MRAKFKDLSKYYRYGGVVEDWARAYSGKIVEIRESKIKPNCWEIINPFIDNSGSKHHEFAKRHFQEILKHNIQINTLRKW